MGDWQAAEEDSVHGAEDSGGGADAEGEGEDDGGGEERELAELAQGAAQIGCDPFEGEGGVGGDGAFPLDDGIAEAEARIAASGLRRHAGCNVVFGAEIDVSLELGVNVAIDTVAGEEVEDAAGEGHGALSIRHA